MKTISPLGTGQLYHACNLSHLEFATTDELQDLSEVIGQMRAMEAVRFGAGIRKDGYNLFALGPSGIGKHSMVAQYLEGKAAAEQKPEDWCYVNNFEHPHKPRAIRLPPGRGVQLRSQMEHLVEYLRSALPALFESDNYRAALNSIKEEFAKQQEGKFVELSEDADKQGIALLRSQEGFAFAPVKDSEVIPPDEFEKLPEEEQQRISTAIAALQKRMEDVMAGVPKWRKERNERIKQLNRETARMAIEHEISEVASAYADLPEVQHYLDSIQHDMIENADDFLKQEETASISGMNIVARQSFHRYQVNVLVSSENHQGAPIINEDNPTYNNLVGRVEYLSQFGALITDFTLIKPGSLHRANGGYLLLDIRKVLMQPFSWEGLKRALKSREIRIESLGQIYNLISTVSLEPEPIALDVKIVMFGDRMFYYLLQEFDPEFGELFKVAVDFEERIERNTDNSELYARMIATLVRRDGLLPFECGAVERVIEQASRQTEDAARLSTHMRSMADLLAEADHWAREAGHQLVAAADVQNALDAQVRRQDRLRGNLQEAILRNMLMIDTEGEVTGQVNALSVIEMGGFAFALPTRITATSRLGEGVVLNIEREVRLSGAIHSKGVLILSSFLASRYARNQPLSLSASLVFEQSYGFVEGDSASMAELCALLSNLAGIPIRQSLAITGSVNQLGHAQVIGAVNEKIEGFFDICQARGLNGQQGVIIPAGNVQNLMLRQDVVAAVSAGKFQVYAVENVDQAMSLLAGMPAGEADEAGHYAAGSVNHAVMQRVTELNEISRKFFRPARHKAAADKTSR